jgi:hypothetical protein
MDDMFKSSHVNGDKPRGVFGLDPQYAGVKLLPLRFLHYARPLHQSGGNYKQTQHLIYNVGHNSLSRLFIPWPIAVGEASCLNF